MTISDFLERWGRGEAGRVVGARYARQRANEVEKHLLPVVGTDATFDELTSRMILDVQRAITAAGLSPTTNNTTVFGTLRAFLRDAEVEGIVPPGFRTRLYAPVYRLRAAPVEDRTPFSVEERDAILAEFRMRRPHFLPFVMMAFGTGARPGELCGLTWRDVDLARRWMRITRSRGERGVTPGKTTHSRREIRLTRLAATGLAALAKTPGAHDDYVFRSSRGAALDLHNFSKRVWPKVLGELAGKVTYRPFYATRHTFISQALMARKTPAEVAAYCGNSVEVIQKHYFRFIGTPGEGWDDIASPPAPSALHPRPEARHAVDRLDHGARSN